MGIIWKYGDFASERLFFFSENSLTLFWGKKWGAEELLIWGNIQHYFFLNLIIISVLISDAKRCMAHLSYFPPSRLFVISKTANYW
jgi:hypothetical protein